MEHLTLIMGAAGAFLTVLGYFAPSLSKVLPRQLDRFWNMVRWDDWSDLAPDSVRRFIRVTEQLANYTAGGARTLGIAVPLVLASTWAVLSLTGASIAVPLNGGNGAIEQAFTQNRGMVIATGVVLAGLAFIKISQGPLQTLVKLTSLRRRQLFQRLNRDRIEHAISQTERRLRNVPDADGDSDGDERSTLEFELEWMKQRLAELKQNLSEIETKIDQLQEGKGLRQIEARTQGKLYQINVVSSVTLVAYFFLGLSNIMPMMGEALFLSDPYSGLVAALYLLLPLTVIFILLQSVLPSTLTLLNPSRLMAKVRANSADPLGQGAIFLVLFGAAISLVLTYGAFALGHSVDPEAYVPQTLQMVLSNAIFDGLTFAGTLIVMRMMGGSRGWLSFVVLIGLIFMDLVLAAMLACLSLYVGLLGSPEALEIQEIINVLLGLDVAGQRPDFGPFFWVMHTAFLPTLGYLSFIAFWALAKFIMAIMLLISRKAAVRGLMPTGALLGALSVLLEVVLRALPAAHAV